MQYQLLPARARRHGLRPLIRYLVRVVGRLVRSARRCRLDFARTNFRLDWLYNAAVQLEWKPPERNAPSLVETGRPGTARSFAERPNAPTDRRIHLIRHPAGHDRTGSGIAVPENPHPEPQSLPCSTLLSGNRGTGMTHKNSATLKKRILAAGSPNQDCLNDEGPGEGKNCHQPIRLLSPTALTAS